MKIIQGSHFETLAQVQCNCCDEDHVCNIKKSKDYKEWIEKDPDEALFYLEFESPDYDRPWPNLKERLRVAKAFLKAKDGEYIDAILLSGEQLIEVYGVLAEHTREFLSEEEINKTIGNPSPVTFTKIDMFPKDKPGSTKWYETEFYHPRRKENELVLFFDGFEEDGKIFMHEFLMGWKITPSIYWGWKQKLDRVKNFLLKKSTSCIRQYEVSLTKDDVVDLLATINSIFNSMKKDERGMTYVCV